MAVIKVLSDKDQARTRINVWHGSATYHMNMIKELIGNSLDVFNPTKLNTITIKMHNNRKIEYIDSGNGIPVEGIASDGRSNAEAIFEKAFAGSKYNNQSDTVGQNGIFLWTLSMTSEDIEYFIARPNGNLYNTAYHKGDKIKELSIIGKSDRTYSKIIFELDTDVWENPIFDYKEICNIAKSQASLGNVKIIVEDLENNKKQEFYYENGIEGYFDDITSNKSIVTDKIKIQKSLQYKIKHNGINKEDKIKINLIFAYSNDSEEDKQREFLNTADLIEHGTIQDGIIAGLKNSVNKWLKDSCKYNKNEKQINNDDIETGLNYVCDVRSILVEYENQTKKKTRACHYKPVMQQVIEEFMEIYFTENTLATEKLCNQILINKRAREKSEKTRLDIKNKLQGNKKGFANKIEGLRDCNMRKSSLEERIFIVDEGISANSTIIDSFDNRIMGALGLRGRFINSLKATIKDVLNNQPALGIIKALGCGIEIPKEERKNFKDIKTFDKNNLRYGSIALLCDADAFGKGINLSLLTFFYKFMPTLVKEGRIYIVRSPRFAISTKKSKVFYAYDEEEKNNIIKEIDANNIESIGIKKGLGRLICSL